MNITLKRKTERANAITHGLAFFGSIVAFPFLLLRSLATDVNYAWLAASVYAFGLAATMLASAVYHALYFTKYHKTTKLLDHLSIFFLIAGTNTPLIPIYLPNSTGTIYLIAMWSLVAIGILLKLRYIESHDRLLTFFYVALGWMAAIVIPMMWSVMPLLVFWMIITGGACYSIGVYFYLRNQRPWNHTIWHIWVMLGAFFHFLAIWFALTPV